MDIMQKKITQAETSTNCRVTCAHQDRRILRVIYGLNGREMKIYGILKGINWRWLLSPKILMAKTKHIGHDKSMWL